jgi:hypothetical protein
MVTPVIKVPGFAPDGTEPPRESAASLDSRGHLLLPAAPGSAEAKGLHRLLAMTPVPEDFQEGLDAAREDIEAHGRRLLGPTSRAIRAQVVSLGRLPALNLSSLALRAAGRAIQDDDLRLVRVSDWSFYRREEGIRDVLPESEKEIQVSIRVGLTESQTHELSRELGSTLGKDKVSSVSAKLSEAFRRTVSLELESTRTEKDTIRNSHTSRIRRVAVWHIVHRITVEVLEEGMQGLRWVQVRVVEHESPGYRLTWVLGD